MRVSAGCQNVVSSKWLNRMIIRPDGDTLLFVTQPDHARLAAELLARWEADGFPAHPRREMILLAAREHDNGWRELDDEIVFDSVAGKPLDFVDTPLDPKQAVWPRAVDRLAEISTYAAALVARHALFIYEAHRGTPEWAEFFRRMAARLEVLRERAAIDAADLESDYRFLCVADLLSLSFCSDWSSPHTRGGVSVTTRAGAMTIAPPVLGNARLPVRVRARRIPARAYASASEVRAALEDAALVLVTGEVRGEPA